MDENAPLNIDEDLHLAYEQCHYRMLVPGLELRIGSSSRGVDNYLAELCAEQLIIITAFNPGSKIVTGETNRRQNFRLYDTIRRTGYNCNYGINQTEDESWPSEDTFWVFDVPLETAVAWGQTFGQVAIVHYPKGGLAQLVYC
ncbi:MAG: DUF3293 domain-containing protein [Bacteroidota bacterium]